MWQKSFPYMLMAAGVGVFATSLWFRSKTAAQTPSSGPASPEEEVVHERLLLASAANDAGACLSANEALVEALSAMGDFSGAPRRRLEDRLRSVLLRRYSDPDGMCL